jgi:hypothetical protein
MGRVKKYSKQHSNKHKNTAKRNKKEGGANNSDSDTEMKSGASAALTVAKRK